MVDGRGESEVDQSTNGIHTTSLYRPRDVTFDPLAVVLPA
jgi:hypothetical protein